MKKVHHEPVVLSHSLSRKKPKDNPIPQNTTDEAETSAKHDEQDLYFERIRIQNMDIRYV